MRESEEEINGKAGGRGRDPIGGWKTENYLSTGRKEMGSGDERP